jgi:protein tyrosine/serine phosphatase
MKNQLELLAKYGVTDYTVENEKITINRYLYLSSLTSADASFLQGTTINGSLDLRSLTSADASFLQGTTINGYLYLRSLTSADASFLQGTTLNGYLYLSSLTSADASFLQGTTINGSLYLRSLTSADASFLQGTTINGSLYLSSLTSADASFLQGTTINGSLDLSSLTSADASFLQGTTINGSLDLRSLTSADASFLQGTTINGYLDLSSLTSADASFLQGTTINGYLYLRSLTSADARICRSNVKRLAKGYNTKGGYCFFDGILAKVTSVSTKKEFTIYTTPTGFVAQKGDYTAHGKSVKSAMSDVAFKEVAEKLKSSPIYADTLLTVMHYRTITGACDQGCREFMQRHGLDYEVVEGKTKERNPVQAKELLPLLEKSQAYGVEKFKALIQS